MAESLLLHVYGVGELPRMHFNKNKLTCWNMSDFLNNDILPRMETRNIIKNTINNRLMEIYERVPCVSKYKYDL